MRKLAAILVCFLLLALTGCFPSPNQLRAVIRTDPSPPRGPYPLTVVFDGSASTGEIEQYLWDFGDGSPVVSNDKVSHLYKDLGKYTVYLTVVAPGGRRHQTSVEVDVRSKPPVAKFSYTLIGANRVQFDASDSYDPDGKIASYHWSFDDGSIDFSDKPVVEHRYRVAGKYEVRLVVVDDYGDPCESPAVEIITVGCPGCGSS